jgi:hypothetical protein
MRRRGSSRALPALWIALSLSILPVALARADAVDTVVIDWPTDGTPVPSSVAVTGWAVAPRAEQGTGVDAVRAYLDGPAGVGTPVGRATYGLTRPDVAQALREGRYGPSGWRVEADLPPGQRSLFVYAHLADQPEDEGWVGPAQVVVRVEGGSAMSGLPAGDRMAAAPATSGPSAACSGRDAGGPACAPGTAPAGQCQVPDRDSGRCLVRTGAANSRGPVAGIPGSWSAADPGALTSAANGGPGAGTTAARVGYPVPASAATPSAVSAPSTDRSPGDAPGSGGASSNAAITSPAASVGTSATTTGMTVSNRSNSASLSLSVASMGGRQVQLSWNAFTAGIPVTYEVRRCASLNSAPATCGVVATVQGGGYRLTQGDGVYFVRALGPQGQPEGESNRVQVCCRS